MTNVQSEMKKSLTVLIPEGLVSSQILKTINTIVDEYNVELYLSTAQNIRILNIQDEHEEEIKTALLAVGATFKGPGKFPLPKVCVGKEYCTLGMVDTFDLSKKISQKFGSKTGVKPKFKIAVSGCPASCANSMITDIGVKATRAGYDVYVGGKGGASPKVGRRIAKGAGEGQVLEIIDKLVAFHEQNTPKKARMSKLINAPDFPYQEV